MLHRPIESAHNTALDHRNLRVSAHVGGVFCRTVERPLGLSTVGIFFAGEQGDLGFRHSRFPGLAGFELAEAIGSDLGERVLDARSGIALDARPRLAVAVERFEPPPATVPISTQPILMQAMILGNSGWLIVSGEPIAEIGLGFKRHMRESGLDQAHVIALANELERVGVDASWRLLDVCCGWGVPTRYLADRFGCQITGIDITQRSRSLSGSYRGSGTAGQRSRSGSGQTR